MKICFTQRENEKKKEFIAKSEGLSMQSLQNHLDLRNTHEKLETRPKPCVTIKHSLQVYNLGVVIY